MSASRAVAGDDRVEHTEVEHGNKDQLIGSLGPPDPWRGERGDARAYGFEQLSSAHDNSSLFGHEDSRQGKSRHGCFETRPLGRSSA